MSTAPVVTRFAPSPTGYLHVGGARTALFNWLTARHAGGTFLLRIEDTDLARSTEAAVVQLLDDLRWLNLQWDNTTLVYQSKRKATYDAIIDTLLSRGLAYKAYETSEELDAMRKQAEKEKRAFVYRRRSLTDDQIRQFESEKRPSVVRFVMPVKDYSFDDQILGRIDLPSSQVQDFVIRKTDGMPTYHFAVVVDDAEMKVTHVVRGQEHTLNTFLHIALQEALGYPRPTYAHLPVILNKDDGKKMGKRDRDKKIRQQAQNWMKNNKQTATAIAESAGLPAARIEAWIENSTQQLDLDEQKLVMRVVGLKETDLPEILVHDFRRNGYLPETMLNFLALLGWNAGGDRERMSVEEMTQLFDLTQVNKSGARFDREKLIAFNTEACASASPERLLSAMRDYLQVHPESALNQASDEQLATLIKMKSGFRVLRDIDEASRFLFLSDEEISFESPAVEKVLRKQNGFTVLRDLLPIFQSVEWNAHAIEKAIEAYCEKSQLGLGKVAQPIRVALSGGTVSPPIFQSLEFLGKPKTLARIERCLALAN